MIRSPREQSLGDQGLQKGVKAEPQPAGPGVSQTPPREWRGRWGTYGSSRLSLLEIQTLSISCKDAQVGQGRNNLALPRDAHIPTLPVPGIVQGAAKTPSFGRGRTGLAPAMGLRRRGSAAGGLLPAWKGSSRPPCPLLPATPPHPGTHHSLLLPLELEADVLGPEEAKGADLELRMKLLPAPGDGQATGQPPAGTGGRPASVSPRGLADRDPLCPSSTSSGTHSCVAAPGTQSCCQGCPKLGQRPHRVTPPPKS